MNDDTMNEGWMDLYEKHTFGQMPYRLLKPIDGSTEPVGGYPLVLSLHGAGGKGTDNVKNLRQWTQTLADENHRHKYPAFVCAPQTPLRWLTPGTMPEMTSEYMSSLPEIWQARIRRLQDRGDSLSAGDLGIAFDLVDALMGEHPIDPDRIYVLGHSMGGFGTWNAICQQPDRFAAAIPSAGGCDPRNDIRRIVDVPVWAFHGNADETVPVDLTRDAFRQLCELQANTKYTELGGVGHGQQHTFVYSGDDPARGFETHYASERCDRTGDVWDWLFAQKRT
jgi:predicted peptidase